MARKKLKRINEAADLPNIIFNPNDYKGKWNTDVFQNDHPIVLELGCGKGDFSLGLSEQNPHINVIGVDMKPDRLWHCAKKALADGNTRLCYIKGNIRYLTDAFQDHSIDSIWITFPDPHPRDSGERKRLTNSSFLQLYAQLLKADGTLELKTDNEALFDFSLDSLKNSPFALVETIRDVHHTDHQNPLLQVTTHYERRYMEEGKPIFYLKAHKNIKTQKEA